MEKRKSRIQSGSGNRIGRYRKIKRLVCFVLAAALFLTVWNGSAYAAETRKTADMEDTPELFEKEVLQGVIYLCDSYEMKAEPDGESGTAAVVPGGTTVRLMGADRNRDGLWYYVMAAVDGTEYYGYVLRDYLAVSNEKLLEWEAGLPEVYGQVWKGIRAANGVDQFPDSYRALLSELAEKHPDWIFVRQDTGVNWDYAVEKEMEEERSLIGSYRDGSWKDGAYSSNWSYASKAAVEYCMDPRNFLDEEKIFQFEQLTYNESYHTMSATQKILQGTFMSGNMPPDYRTSYTESFVEIGRELRVSPFHLASRVAQEQGRGTSPLISGNYPGYEGYYNYFNIEASGASNEEIYKTGLEKARKEGWTSPYLSIRGGAEIIAQKYILKGQDTLYLQKFDVDASYNGMFWHQYMQNIEAPGSEAVRIARAYQNAGAFNNSFVFKIPVYRNMPSDPCPEPKEGIRSADIYLEVQDDGQLAVWLNAETAEETDLEYRWLIYDYSTEVWSEERTWTLNEPRFVWNPPGAGAYLIQGEVRIPGSGETVTAVTGYNHVPEEIHILGKCQMPYIGEGGGYLIGVETDKNPGQKLQYELMILDCTLLAKGEDAWIWSTGKCGVSEGNAFWAVWQPQYGYYWTLFRVYDENGNLLAEECYGFENIC